LKREKEKQLPKKRSAGKKGKNTSNNGEKIILEKKMNFVLFPPNFKLASK
jgi:hypothetical protein